jgi:hypothetical protein
MLRFGAISLTGKSIGKPVPELKVPEKILINAVAFQEGEAWVVQGIEYDIVAHAYDVKALPDAFGRAVMENIVITEHLGRRPLEGIKPAPKRFRDLFELARVELRGVGFHEGPNVAVRLAAA